MTESKQPKQQSAESASDYGGPERRTTGQKGDGRRQEPARHGTGRRQSQGEVKKRDS